MIAINESTMDKITLVHQQIVHNINEKLYRVPI